jgi:hypothetical protein
MQQIYQWVEQNELQKLARVDDDLSFLVDEVKLAEALKSIEITKKEVNQQRENFQNKMNGLFGIFDQWWEHEKLEGKNTLARFDTLFNIEFK